MNLKTTLSAAALTVPALAGLFAPADKLAFRPAAGSELVRTWEIKQEMSLDEQTMSVDGKPFPSDVAMEMDLSTTFELGIRDELVELGDGRPKLLRRHFDKLGSSGSYAMEMMGNPNERSMTGSSGLEGKTVQFTWDPDDSSYTLAFHESDGEAELLEGLEEDLDLRKFLPAAEVAEGDTWQLEPEVLRSVLHPGGDLRIRPNLDADEREAMGSMGLGMESFQDMSSMLGESVEGSVTAEYKGSREVDGVTVGEIHLVFKLKSANDATETMREMLANVPEEMGQIEIDHMDVELTYEGQATLMWDIAGGHAHSLEMDGDMVTKQDMGMSISAQGRSANIEVNTGLSGSMTFKVTVAKG